MHGFENGSYAIVHDFSGQQLHKNTDLCNCWPYFEQTIAYETGSPAKTPCPCRQVKKLLLIFGDQPIATCQSLCTDQP